MGATAVGRPDLSKDFHASTAPDEWMPLRAPEYYFAAGAIKPGSGPWRWPRFRGTCGSLQAELAMEQD
jgi:hypothetical protein